MPPREASAPGSIGKKRPLSRRYSFSCLRVTPAWTRQSRSSALTSRMAFIRLRSMQTPPFSAAMCPSREVPVPKGTIGVLWAAQRDTISATSSFDSAKATASGGAPAWKLTSLPCCSRTAKVVERRSPRSFWRASSRSFWRPVAELIDASPRFTADSRSKGQEMELREGAVPQGRRCLNAVTRLSPPAWVKTRTRVVLNRNYYLGQWRDEEGRKYV